MIVGFIVMIVVVIALLIAVYKGLDTFIGCCIAACLVCLGCRLPIYSTMMGTFWQGASNILASMGFCVVLSVLLGQVYLRSGAAETIGKLFRKLFIKEGASPFKMKLTSAYVYLIVAMILCFCGMNVYVATFCLIPMGASLFKAADLPKKPVAGILAGSLSMAACCPGTPLYTNVLGSAFFGRTATAGLVPGLIGVFVMFVLNMLWIYSFCKKAVKKDLHYVETSGGFFSLGGPEGAPKGAPLPPGPGGPPAPGTVPVERKLPHWALALIPLILNVVLYGFLGWQIEPTLIISIVLSLILFAPNLKEGQKWSIKPLTKLLTAGVTAAFPIVMYMAAQMGYAQVVSSTDVFGVIIGWLQNLPFPAYITFGIFAALSGFLASDAVAGLVFSSAAFLPVAGELGMTAGAMHRIALFAVSILDTLPICAGVIAMLKAAGMTHKEGYSCIFRTTVVYPFIGMAVCIAVCMLFPALT